MNSIDAEYIETKFKVQSSIEYKGFLDALISEPDARRGSEIRQVFEQLD